MRFLRAIILLLAALVKRGQSASLATFFNGTNPDNESDGDKFTITTKNFPIVLERFDIHMMNTTATIQVYTRTGCKNVTNLTSWGGDGLKYLECGYPQEYNTGDWTLRYNSTLTGLGKGVPTPMAAINLGVPANTTLGVYITSRTQNAQHIYHTLGQKFYSGPIISPGMPTPSFASDDYIRIHEGGSHSSFHGNYAFPTLWNGKWCAMVGNSTTFDDMKIVLD